MQKRSYETLLFSNNTDLYLSIKKNP